MVDTGAVVVVDLNADLAEGEVHTARDAGLLEVVTSVSVACGYHAGNRAVMRATVEACVARGVVVGAHVSYRDREGFGRRALAVTPAQLLADVADQCLVLLEEADAVGGTVAFVKPHGALYHRVAADPDAAEAVVDAMTSLSIAVLVGQSGSAVIEPARRAGLRVVREGFPDRGYLPDGTLTARGHEASEVTDPAVVARRAVSLVVHGGVQAVTGEWTRVAVDTLCIHGDAPGALDHARAVRRELDAAGIEVRPFVGPVGGR